MNFKVFKSPKESIYTDPSDSSSPICYHSKVGKFCRLRSSQQSPYMEIYNSADFPGSRCSYHLSDDKSIDVVSSKDSHDHLYTRADFYNDKKYGNGFELRYDKYGIMNFDQGTMLFYDGFKFYLKRITKDGTPTKEIPLEGFYQTAFNNLDFVYYNQIDDIDVYLNPTRQGNNYFEADYGECLGFSLNSWDECFRIGFGNGYKFNSTAMWLQDGKAHVGSLRFNEPEDKIVFALDKNLRMFSIGKLSESGLYMEGLAVEVSPNKARIFSNRDFYGASKNSYVLEWDAVTNRAVMYFVDGNGEKKIDFDVTL